MSIKKAYKDKDLLKTYRKQIFYSIFINWIRNFYRSRL